QLTAVILLGIIMVFDLVQIDKKYVNSDDFVNARRMEIPFELTNADSEILKDNDLHYRVFEPQGGMSSARTSYFHKSIGGYSAVKPQRFQQLYDYQIAQNNIDVLNMLNVKYLLQPGEGNETFYSINPYANGNAWFVEEIKAVNSADEEISALDSLNTQSSAVINIKDFPEKAKEILNVNFKTDSLSFIKLIEYKPNYLKYETQNEYDGLAVFSEIYYPKGWKVSIDGKESDMFRVNYVLRALQIPAGKHTVEFKFEPEVVKKGSRIALFSSISMFLLLITGIYFEAKKQTKK
ncbi:MAG TPA: YfhO family protein, partial [Flavobacterium sp.]|nr:YfhO family protein [Flavobacterium sp.]